MSHTGDVVVLSSRTPQIEDAERRYIDALEKRIAALELQAGGTFALNEQPPIRNKVDPALPPDASSGKTNSNEMNDVGKAPENTPAEAEASTASTEGDKNAKAKQEEKEKEESKQAKLLKNLSSVQAYSRFFDKVKITARRYSKIDDERQQKPLGDEEVISDAKTMAAQGTTTDDSSKESSTSSIASAEEDIKKNKTSAPVTFSLGVNEDDFVFKATAKINDLNLQALIQIFFAHYPSFGPDLVVLSLDSPFEPFVQHWWDLKALLKGEADHPAVQQFRARVLRFKVMDHELTGWPQYLRHFVHADNGTEKAKANLELLMDLIYEAIKGRLGEQSLLRTLQDDPTQSQEEVVSFENIWTVYKPGEVVVSHLFQDEPQAFIVYESMESGMERGRKPSYWSLSCWSYDWTGKTFRRVGVELRVDFFKGTRKLSMLSVYPIKYLAQKDRDKMEARGHHFHDICTRDRGSRVFGYSGEAILRGSGIGKVQLVRQVDNMDDDRRYTPSEVLRRLLREVFGGQDFTNITTVEIDGGEQVMIDALSFRRDGPGKHYQQKHQMPMGKVRFVNFEECRCSICQQNYCLVDSQKTQYDLEPTDFTFKDSMQYLICPPRVLGYHLSRKRWVELNVNGVHEAERKVDTSAFDNLQMESTRSKVLLRTLVTSHWNKKRSDNKGKMTDLMKGKGESLVILLYGPPGVGKTLTAESVAKASGKPLLSVTVADIGLDPEKIEENLMHVFRLAASWEAIILFDEADVFLESRSSDTASLQRNSLVSELLRVLEYYDGMLILTTNRLRRFDHAVMSRINLAVRYPDLSHEQKKRIFLHFIQQLDDDSTADLALIERWIHDEDTREQLNGLNGRQIRNILFSAARITSEQEGGKLSLDAIKQLTQATKRFAVEIHAEQEASRVKNEPGYR